MCLVYAHVWTLVSACVCVCVLVETEGVPGGQMARDSRLELSACQRSGKNSYSTFRFISPK